MSDCMHKGTTFTSIVIHTDMQMQPSHNIMYVVGSDRDLREAVYQGVPAIILSSDISLRDRETIAQLLNSKREFKWCIGENGEVDILGAAEDTTQCKQFEALSKVREALRHLGVQADSSQTVAVLRRYDADRSGGIELRDEVTHINGTKVHDHEAATALVRAAVRDVVFVLRRVPTSHSPDVLRRLRQQRVLDALNSKYRA